MSEFLKPYLLTFIPIFVAVDALGNIPLFISLTEDLNETQKRQAIKESVSTATILAILFMFLGKLILRIMGITVSDFKIAGGILLLVISINLLLPGKSKISNHNGLKNVGIFPLGTPLVTGPAVLTTTLMMLDGYGLMPTFIALVINMGIVWFAFAYSFSILRLMGEAGVRAFSKIADILLASIAVMMIRKGLTGILL